VEILHAEAGIAEARSLMRERLEGEATAAPGCPGRAGAVTEADSEEAPGCPVHAGAVPAEGGHHHAQGEHPAGAARAAVNRTDYDHGLNEGSAPMVDMLGRRMTTAEAASLGST